MSDLLRRIFLNWRTSLDGAVLAVIAWLSSNGIDLSETNKTKLLGWAALFAAAVWKLFSKDPVPAPPDSGGNGGNSVIGSKLGSVSFLLPLVLVIGIAGSQSACGEDQQKVIATNVDRIAILIQNTREVRDELFAQGLIDKDDAYKVTVALVKVNTATRTFKDRAQNYKASGALTPSNRDTLRALANDIASAITELVSNGTFNIKNPDAQAKVNAAVGSFRQVALALIEAIDALKPTKAEVIKISSPVQTSGFPLAIVPLLLLALRQVVGFVSREKARTGKTAEEIYAEAGVQLEANDLALLEDLTKYGPEETFVVGDEDLEATR